MMDNHHEVMIRKNQKFVSTGHNSEIVQDQEGQDWMLYHAVSVDNPKGRVLMMDQVRWKDEWPYVEGNTSSLTSLVLFIVSTVQATARVAENDFSSSIALKIPGNNAAHYPLQEIRKGDVVQLKANRNIPVVITRTIVSPNLSAADHVVEVVITAFSKKGNPSGSRG